MAERCKLVSLGNALFKREMEQVRHTAVFQKRGAEETLLLACVSAGGRGHVFPPFFVECLQVMLLGEETEKTEETKEEKKGQVVPCKPLYSLNPEERDPFDDGPRRLWQVRRTEDGVPFGFDLFIRPLIPSAVFSLQRGTRRVANVRAVRFEHAGGRVDFPNLYFSPGNTALLGSSHSTVHRTA